MVISLYFLSRLRGPKICSVSSLYRDQAITGLLKSCKGWGKVLWERFEFKIQINGSHSNKAYMGGGSKVQVSVRHICEGIDMMYRQSD